MLCDCGRSIEGLFNGPAEEERLEFQSRTEKWVAIRLDWIWGVSDEGISLIELLRICISFSVFFKDQQCLLPLSIYFIKMSYSNFLLRSTGMVPPKSLVCLFLHFMEICMKMFDFRHFPFSIKSQISEVFSALNTNFQC